MAQVITAQEMRDLERSAIESGAVTGLELMERAGNGVVSAMAEEWPTLTGQTSRAVVLCGPGNNGGDGFVIARLLRDAGWPVDVFFYGTAKKLPADAQVNHDRCQRSGPVHPLGFPQTNAAAVRHFQDKASHTQDIAEGRDHSEFRPFVVIDALFGVGLTRPLSGLGDLPAHWDYLHLFRDLNDSRLVAVDVPSGLDTDTGEILWGDETFPILPADLTVTFHAPKPCHLNREALPICGELAVKDIGL